jgi:hypothetical protein
MVDVIPRYLKLNQLNTLEAEYICQLPWGCIEGGGALRAGGLIYFVRNLKGIILSEI